MKKKIIVVGAGLAGLSAAFRLKQAGADVRVLESGDRIGGRTSVSHRKDGFTMNRSATVIGASYKAMLKLARDVGVGDQIVKVPTGVGIYHRGTIHWLRTSGLGMVIDFLRTP